MSAEEFFNTFINSDGKGNSKNEYVLKKIETYNTNKVFFPSENIKTTEYLCSHLKTKESFYFSLSEFQDNFMEYPERKFYILSHDKFNKINQLSVEAHGGYSSDNDTFFYHIKDTNDVKSLHYCLNGEFFLNNDITGYIKDDIYLQKQAPIFYLYNKRLVLIDPLLAYFSDPIEKMVGTTIAFEKLRNYKLGCLTHDIAKGEYLDKFLKNKYCNFLFISGHATTGSVLLFAKKRGIKDIHFRTCKEDNSYDAQCEAKKTGKLIRANSETEKEMLDNKYAPNSYKYEKKPIEFNIKYLHQDSLLHKHELTYMYDPEVLLRMDLILSNKRDEINNDEDRQYYNIVTLVARYLLRKKEYKKNEKIIAFVKKELAKDNSICSEFNKLLNGNLISLFD